MSNNFNLNPFTPQRSTARHFRWLPVAKTCLILAGLGGLGGIGQAWSLDLRQTYEAAANNDASIKASRAAANAGRERLPQARSQLFPNVAVNVSRNHNDLTTTTRGVDQDNDYYSGNQNLTIRQPIYRPQITASVQQAQAQVQDVEATLDRDEQNLVIRVAEAYFDALLAHDQLALVAAQKANYTTQLDAARKGLQAGSGTRTDVDEAQARLDMTYAQELEAIQNQAFMQRKLETLTGQPMRDLAGLDVQRFQPESPMPNQLQDWVEMTSAASPELRALRAQMEAARLEIDKAQAGHKPTLDAVAQWVRSSSDSVTSVNVRHNQKVVGLQLSVPLYSGGYVNSTIRQAVASHERAREALDAARLDLEMRVYKEFRGMTEGVLRIAALEQAVRSAEQAVLSSRKSYEAGSRTTVDVLNAEQQKISALRDLAQARYLYLVSRLRLQSLAGQDRWGSIDQANAVLAHSRAVAPPLAP